MAIGDFTNQNIQDTYKRVVQTDGTNLADGSGSLLPISFEGNNVIVSGSLTAQTYVVSESIINVSSGSTIFGNSEDDSHTFTGALTASNFIKTDSGMLSPKYSIGGIAFGFDVGHGVIGVGYESGININIGKSVCNITLHGSTTASGDISASGVITANRFDIDNNKFAAVGSSGTFDIGQTGQASLNLTHITASGNISASGQVQSADIITTRIIAGDNNTVVANPGINSLTFPTPITASGNISASGILTVNNIELPPDGAIRPTANNNTISFRAADHGSGEFMEIGDDLFKVYQQGVSTFNITRNGDHEGTITLNDSNKNFDVIIKSDATNDIFTADASADLIKTRGRLNIGNLTVPSAAGGLNQTTHELYVTGSTFLSGSLESSGEISGIINGGKF